MKCLKTKQIRIGWNSDPTIFEAQYGVQITTLFLPVLALLA